MYYRCAGFSVVFVQMRNYVIQKKPSAHVIHSPGSIPGFSRKHNRRNGAAGSASDCGSGGREIKTHLRQIIFFFDTLIVILLLRLRPYQNCVYGQLQ